MVVPISTQVSARHTALALDALDESGLQAPSRVDLKEILRFGYSAAFLLWAAALEEPSHGELDEIFKDFVVRCVNRAPGVGDALYK